MMIKSLISYLGLAVKILQKVRPEPVMIKPLDIPSGLGPHV